MLTSLQYSKRNLIYHPFFALTLVNMPLTGYVMSPRRRDHSQESILNALNPTFISLWNKVFSLSSAKPPKEWSIAGFVEFVAILLDEMFRVQVRGLLSNVVKLQTIDDEWISLCVTKARTYISEISVDLQNFCLPQLLSSTLVKPLKV